MTQVHGDNFHAVVSDGCYSFKGFDRRPRQRAECFDPHWERPIEVDQQAGHVAVDAVVRTRRLFGSSIPDAIEEYGFTLEEREQWEAHLDRMWLEEGCSLSELTDNRGPSVADRRAGFAEAANSRKFMQAPHRAVKELGASIIERIAKGDAPSPEEMKTYSLLVAADLMNCNNPQARARGLLFFEKWAGGISTAGADDHGEEYGFG